MVWNRQSVIFASPQRVAGGWLGGGGVDPASGGETGYTLHWSPGNRSADTETDNRLVKNWQGRALLLNCGVGQSCKARWWVNYHEREHFLRCQSSTSPHWQSLTRSHTTVQRHTCNQNTGRAHPLRGWVLPVTSVTSEWRKCPHSVIVLSGHSKRGQAWLKRKPKKVQSRSQTLFLVHPRTHTRTIYRRMIKSALADMDRKSKHVYRHTHTHTTKLVEQIH